MHAIYDLKEMLCKQLEDYGKKGEMNAAVLERVDMLAHAVKNLDKIIESYEETEYSERGGRVYGNGNSYRGGSYEGGQSRARKRDSMGRYSSNGYSNHGDMVDQLRDMMADAPDDRTRQEMQRLISRMEGM